MIAAVITGARNAGNGFTPPSISSRLPKVGSRSAFLYVIMSVDMRIFIVYSSTYPFSTAMCSIVEPGLADVSAPSLF